MGCASEQEGFLCQKKGLSQNGVWRELYPVALHRATSPTRGWSVQARKTHSVKILRSNPIYVCVLENACCYISKGVSSYFFPSGVFFSEPFQECSPVLGTDCLKFEWFVPQDGTAVLKGSWSSIYLTR